MFRFSQEHREFIQSNVSGRIVYDLTEMFNARFGTELTYNQMRAFIKNNGLKSGVITRFPSGHEPFNKGKPRTWTGGEETRFKAGNIPHNYVSVGSERVNADGYVDIKIEDPNKWRGKHLVVWEQHHGRKVPKGHVVIFGDRDRRNFDPDNLALVYRAQLAVMNQRQLIQNNADLTRTGIIIADIYKKLAQRKKG
jgi:hypothetical protein